VRNLLFARILSASISCHSEPASVGEESAVRMGTRSRQSLPMADSSGLGRNARDASPHCPLPATSSPEWTSPPSSCLTPTCQPVDFSHLNSVPAWPRACTPT